MIIIGAKDNDPHAVAVVHALGSHHREEVFIFDTSTFPRVVDLTSTIDGTSDRHLLTTHEGRRIPLHEVKSFWWRRPQAMFVHPGIENAEARNFTYQECVSGIYGALACCGDALWVNDIQRDVAAEYKPLQLKVAAELGLRIPRTLITNQAERVVEFWREHDRKVIYKAFNQRGLVWCATRMLTEESLAMLDNVRHAPVIFQALVPGIRDIRVTVVGPTIFATEFDIEDTKAVDYRVEMGRLACAPHQLPSDIIEVVRRMMMRLGLEYGGIDFRLTPGGDYVFFEINTAGEFMYIQDRTGQPIAEAMAAHLASGEAAYTRAA
jgi:glutathione synthase/RimK-type ligase-like ATP-grasp enzyme